MNDVDYERLRKNSMPRLEMGGSIVFISQIDNEKWKMNLRNYKGDHFSKKLKRVPNKKDFLKSVDDNYQLTFYTSGLSMKWKKADGKTETYTYHRTGTKSFS